MGNTLLFLVIVIGGNILIFCRCRRIGSGTLLRLGLLLWSSWLLGLSCLLLGRCSWCLRLLGLLGLPLGLHTNWFGGLLLFIIILLILRGVLILWLVLSCPLCSHLSDQLVQLLLSHYHLSGATS
jgi:hypothetical protein